MAGGGRRGKGVVEVVADLDGEHKKESRRPSDAHPSDTPKDGHTLDLSHHHVVHWYLGMALGIA